MKNATKKAAALLLSLACLLSAATLSARAAEDTATREYTVSALARAAGLTGGDTQALSVFTDAGEVDSAYAPALAAAVEKGIVRGCDRMLRPREPVSRAEALVMLSRCLPEAAEYTDAVYFSDVPLWAASEIGRLSRAGLVTGENGAALGANEPLTAAEVDALARQAENCLLMKELEDAGTLEAMLRRHSSVTLTGKELVAGEDFLYTHTFTPELTVRENPDQREMVTDGMYLYVPEDEPDAVYAKPYTSDYILEMIAESIQRPAEVNFSAEEFLSAQRRDGKLYVETLQTEPDSVAAFEDALACEYRAGDVLRLSRVFDAESRDILSMKCLLERADGSTLILEESEYVYDAGYDAAASPFAAYLNAEKTREVTVTYAQDTAFASTKTYRLPKTVPFILRTLLEEGADSYTDAACTQAYTGSAPEDYSPLHLYVPFELRDATKDDEAKFAELVEANSIDRILKRYENKMITVTHYDKNGDTGSFLDYADGLSTAYEEPDRLNNLNTGELSVWMQEGIVIQDLMPEDWYAGNVAEEQERGSLRLLDSEKLTHFGEDEEFLYFASEVTDPAAARNAVEWSQEFLDEPVVWEEGDRLVYLNLFGRESGDLLFLGMFLRTPDGKLRLLQDEQNDYGVTYAPEQSVFAPYFEMKERGVRTVNVVWASGTAEEKTVSYQVPAGVFISGPDFYTDPACTQPYDITNRPTGDLTVYVRAGDF